MSLSVRKHPEPVIYERVLESSPGKPSGPIKIAESNQILILSNFDHGGRPITNSVASDTRAAVSITHPLFKNKQFTAQATGAVDKSPRQHPSITRQSKADDCGQACTRRTTSQLIRLHDPLLLGLICC